VVQPQQGLRLHPAESANDVFVHISTIQEGGPLEEGQAVEFDITEGRKSPRPANV
jgi:CspA family cold shock protein